MFHSINHIKPWFFLLSLILFFGGCHQKTNNSNEAAMLPFVPATQGEFKVYSNPHANNIIVTYFSNNEGRGLLSILFTDGNVLERKQVTVVKGSNTWEYVFPKKSTGFFLVKFSMNNTERVAKVFKDMY